MPTSGDVGASVMFTSEQTSGGTVGTYKGRKFVSKDNSPAWSRIPKNVNLDGLHQAMAEDSTAVDVLKREMLMVQELEAQESLEQLEILKRTHDKLHTKAEELGATNGKRFEELEIANNTLIVKKKATIPERHLARLQVELRKTDKRHQEAIMAKKKIEFIVKRVTKEAGEVKKEVRLLQAQLQAAVSEASSSECQLQQSRQELKTEEERLEKLRSKVNRRIMLQAESQTGLQQVFEERSVQLLDQEERIHQRDNLLTKSGRMFRSDEESKLGRTCVVRKLYSNILQRKMEEELRHLGALEEKFQQIKDTTGLSGVDEIIDRYQMRAGKNQQLHQMAEEIRQRIETLRKENQQQRQWLDDRHRVQEATSGNRDMYQEVDLIDVALESARKQCDDAKERANRLGVTVDRLRDALSRFMSKVDSKTHSVSPQSKLPEVMAQLDFKITHMMKAVSAALVKDERGPGGAGGSSGGGVEGAGIGDSSPPRREMLSKLDNASVTKILFQNIMKTEPDTSPRNLRVTPSKMDNESYEKKMKMKILLGSEYVSDGDDDRDSEEASEEEQEDPRDTFVDRTAVKKLAKLVPGRDTKSRGTRTRRLKRRDG